MARIPAPHEIIEILSDEDSPPPARTSSQARSADARKSNITDSVKRTSMPGSKKKPRPAQDGFAARHSASATPSSKHPTALKGSADGNSRSARDSGLPPLPLMSNGRTRERNTASHAANGTTTTDIRSLPQIHIVSDDDEPPNPPARTSFVWPRGLSPDTSISEDHGSKRSQDGAMSSPKKRHRERDSPSTNTGPSKRHKLSQSNGDLSAAQKSGKISTADERLRSSSPTQKRFRSTPTVSRLAGRDARVNSTSSSPHRRRDTPSTPSDDEDIVSPTPAIAKPRSSLKTNGEPHRSSPSSKKRSQDKEDHLANSSGAPTRPTGSQKPSALLNGASTPRSGNASQARQSLSIFERPKSKDDRATSGDDPGPRGDDPKALSTNGQNLSTSKASHSPSPSKRSHRENEINGLRKWKQGSPRRHSPANQKKDAVHDSPSLTNGSNAVTSGTSSSVPANIAKRVELVEDDQGYASLSPENGDSHQRQGWLNPEEIRKVKSEEQLWRYEELEQRGAEHGTGHRQNSDSQDRLHQLDSARLRSAQGSPEAAVISRETDSQRAVQTSAAELTEVSEVQKSPPGRENHAINYLVSESDAADLQLRSEALQGSVAEDIVMADSESAFAQPTTAASALRAASLYSGLSLASRVEKVLGGYMEELRGDNEYWTSVSLRRARLFREDANDTATSDVNGEETTELPTSFVNLKPLKLFPHKKGSSTAKSDEVWGIQRMTNDGRPQTQVEMSASYTTFATDQQDVPDFAHYVSLRSNLLAPNVIHLHCWPYFGDDFDMNEAQNLSSQYNIDIVARERKILLLLQAQMHERYVESALQDLDCSFADVLRFLLEVSPDVGSDLDARKAFQNRGLYCQEDFSRSSDRWTTILSHLPPSNPAKLGRVALLCENFQKMAKFSLWHIARKSAFANLPDEKKQTTAAHPSDNELTCRICLRFNCPYHGQFKHRSDDSGGESDTESISSADTAVATDIIHPLKANHRSRITLMPDAAPEPEPNALLDPLLRKKRDQNYWHGYRHKADERGPFYPCSHPGLSCSDAKCSCFAKMIPCEKTCGCAADCLRKFKGCACGSKKGNQMVCAENAECVCWQNGRECDPDLCGSCGVCDVVDPVNKYDERVLIGHCRNAAIQRGVPKHTILGDSGVHGLGLYACEDIKSHHFVGEYKGEIITKKEADRRGAVYEHQKLSYLFSLNKSQEIDSTYFGNKVRFINHAHGEKANLYPRIIMVNTVHRIALYASKDIAAGKELLFDYGPLFPDEQLQGKKSKKSAPESKKSAPHVRNANLVKEFYDVEESEDEDGILRAKARGRGRPTNRKPRGGPRSGAGRKPQATRPSQPEVSKGLQPARDLEQDAGERLAAFNISDDTPSEAVEPEAGAEEEEEDAAFEPEDSESVDSEESEEEGESDDSADEDDDEGHEAVRRGRGRLRGGGVSTRRRGRR